MSKYADDTEDSLREEYERFLAAHPEVHQGDAWEAMMEYEGEHSYRVYQWLILFVCRWEKAVPDEAKIIGIDPEVLYAAPHPFDYMSPDERAVAVREHFDNMEPDELLEVFFNACV